MDIELPQTVPGHGQIAIRLMLAALVGAVLGLDREYKKRPAGLRTHILIAMASALFSIISLEIVGAIKPGSDKTGDPVRIIEAVTAGVAFLAAGSIIQSGAKVHGLTTGAGMWLAGAAGLACGVGLWSIGFMAAAIGVFILAVIGRWENSVIPDAPEKAPGPDRKASNAPPPM